MKSPLSISHSKLSNTLVGVKVVRELALIQETFNAKSSDLIKFLFYNRGKAIAKWKRKIIKARSEYRSAMKGCVKNAQNVPLYVQVFEY